MTITLHCPGCQHALCLLCLKATWELMPRQTKLVESLTPDSAHMLMCCSCHGGNDKSFWKETRHSQARVKIKQPDLFLDRDT